MGAHTHLDEKNVLHIIYDTPEDIMSTTYYQPGDPLYEKGIGGQMLLNLPRFDHEGKPEIFQKIVELPVLTSAKRNQLIHSNPENLIPEV
ncbi:MAG: hypothetical protein IPI96_15210 [Saprospiraceae bacterium]|nr:hypothetical protein [Saprospiraceae bacterium]